MPRAPSSQEVYDRLSRNRFDPAAPGAEADVQCALENKSHVIVTKAAEVAAEAKFASLAPVLINAFSRFASDAKYPDPNSSAIKAIVDALVDLKVYTRDAVEKVYLQGIHIFRPSRGEDPAGHVRGQCAIGLVGAGDADALVKLTDLLVDPDKAARAGAARALGGTGQDAAALLLRLNLLQRRGTDDYDVLCEYMNALVLLWPDKSLPFIRSYLSHDGADTAIAAALALGASKKPAAFEMLQSAFKAENRMEVREALIVAIGTSRQRGAAEFLGNLARSCDEESAVAAIKAMGLYRWDEAVGKEAAAIAESRGGKVAAAFAKAFKD